MKKFLFLTFLFFAFSILGEDYFIYKTKENDNLISLGKIYLENPSQWKELLKHNPWIKNPNFILPNQEIKIPYPLLKKNLYSAKIEKISGDVKVKKEEKDWQKAEEGMLLVQKDKLKTEKNSQAVLNIPEENKVLVEPETEITINELWENPFNKARQTNLGIIKGKIQAVIKKIFGGSKFSVKTPSAVSLIRGTEFRVKTKDDASFLEVWEGKVREENDLGFVDVPENYGVRILKDEIPMEPKLLPPPPKLFPEDGVVIGSSKGAFLLWEKLDIAKSYKIQISKDPNFFNIVYENETMDDNITVPYISPGFYFWRVISIDDTDLESKGGNVKGLLFPEKIYEN